MIKKILALSSKIKIITSVIIVGLVGGIVACGILIHNNIKFQNEVIIKKEVTININDKLPTLKSYVSKWGNLNKDAKLDYGKLKNTSNIGLFDVIITSNNKTYKSKLNIVDKEEPVLKLKDVVIEEGNDIEINSFVESCEDNINKECKFYYVDENNKEIDDIDKSVGKRKIFIVAEDINGNKTKAYEANLEVTKKAEVKTTTTNKAVSSKNDATQTTESYDPEKGCYKTPENSSLLAYRFPCGVTAKEASNQLEYLKANYFKERISKVMDDNSYGHGSNFNAGYYFISAKYNSSYVVGIHVPFSLMDTVDKVSSYGYLKEDGTAQWVYYREAGR